MRELSEVLELGDVIIDSRFGFVCIPFLDESFDLIDDLWYMF